MFSFNLGNDRRSEGAVTRNSTGKNFAEDPLGNVLGLGNQLGNAVMSNVAGLFNPHDDRADVVRPPRPALARQGSGPSLMRQGSEVQRQSQILKSIQQELGRAAREGRPATSTNLAAKIRPVAAQGGREGAVEDGGRPLPQSSFPDPPGSQEDRNRQIEAAFAEARGGGHVRDPGAWMGGIFPSQSPPERAGKSVAQLAREQPSLEEQVTPHDDLRREGEGRERLRLSRDSKLSQGAEEQGPRPSYSLPRGPSFSRKHARGSGEGRGGKEPRAEEDGRHEQHASHTSHEVSGGKAPRGWAETPADTDASYRDGVYGTAGKGSSRDSWKEQDARSRHRDSGGGSEFGGTWKVRDASRQNSSGRYEGGGGGEAGDRVSREDLMMLQEEMRLMRNLLEEERGLKDAAKSERDEVKRELEGARRPTEGAGVAKIKKEQDHEALSLRLADREAELRVMESELRKMQEGGELLRKELARRDGEVKKAERELGKREEAESLVKKETLVERERRERTERELQVANHELGELRKEVRRIEAEEDRLREEVRERDRELGSLNSEAATVKLEVSREREARLRIEKDLELALQSRDQKDKELSMALKKCVEKEDELDRALARCEDVELGGKARDLEGAAWRRERQELLDEAAAEKAKREAAEGELEHAHRKLEEGQRDGKVVDKERAEWKAEREALENEAKAERERRERSESLLRQLREARMEGEKSRAAEDARRDKELSELRAQLKEEKAGWEDARREFQRERDKGKKLLLAGEAELEELRSKLEIREMEIESLQAALSGAASAEPVEGGVVDSLKEQLALSRVEVELQASQIESLKADLDEAQQQLARSNWSTKEEVQVLRGELDREKDKSRRLEREKAAFEEEVGGLRTRLLELEREVSESAVKREVRAGQSGGSAREEELEAKLARVLQALMEEEIRGEQARQREAAALFELSQKEGGVKGTQGQNPPNNRTPSSPMDIRTPGGARLTPVEWGAATEPAHARKPGESFRSSSGGGAKNSSTPTGISSLFADSPETPGKRLVYDTPEIRALRRTTGKDGGALSRNVVHEIVGKFEGRGHYGQEETA